MVRSKKKAKTNVSKSKLNKYRKNTLDKTIQESATHKKNIKKVLNPDYDTNKNKESKIGLDIDDSGTDNYIEDPYMRRLFNRMEEYGKENMLLRERNRKSLEKHILENKKINFEEDEIKEIDTKNIYNVEINKSTPKSENFIKFTKARFEIGTKSQKVKIINKRTIRNKMINKGKKHMLTSKEKDEIEKLVKIGFSQRQIEKQTLISRTTISSFIARTLKENKNARSKGRPEKINKDQKEYIIGLVEFNPFITLREIKDVTHETKELDVSTSSISRMLLKKKITVKRTQIIPVERNSPRTVELRFDYVNNFY